MGISFRRVLNKENAIASLILLLVPMNLCAQAQLPASQFDGRSCAVTGGTNNGLIIQNCGVIYLPSQPNFQVIKEMPITRTPDGLYHRVAIIDVDSPYAPNNIVYLAKGLTVKDVRILGSGMHNSGMTPGGWHFDVLATPWGRYNVEVITTDDASPVQMQIAFNVK